MREALSLAWLSAKGAKVMVISERYAGGLCYSHSGLWSSWDILGRVGEPCRGSNLHFSGPWKRKENIGRRKSVRERRC